ncbi:hypothetical protein ES288_A08G202900v1 [Gossypium darwinii]|uniref:DNA-directed RNA polymerase RpoA/D/Rpb3-type domain-containing protein n=3 Tax=Gossypium TaxID=3633 RepID=A0A5D2FNK6_GOSDA|nr:hypothetical protein ES288_D01G001900v1 [Gossypium darwinii]TYH07063.1 hypothetical protein ES288_A08G202900v1 [Gossypium darwinii]TYH07064.1 hypothetical protein ES288_A08G202900v1 [Gossypium darwinii]
MAEPMEISFSSGSLNLQSIRSRMNDLSEIHNSNKNDVGTEALSSDSEKLLKDCSFHFQSKVKQIIEEYSDVGFLGIEDLDKYLAYLKEELNQVEAESAKISNEIEDLSRNHIEESNMLEDNLEGLECALDSIASQEREEEDPCFDSSMNGENQLNLLDANEGQKFEILELESQIEKNNLILKSLQDLDSTFRRLDALEQIEDALTGLKVIGFDGNCIRLSLQTYIPKVEGVLCQNMSEDIFVPKVVVVDPEAYTYDDEVLKKAEAMGKPGLVEIYAKEDSFIFTVESTGAIKASQLVLNAIEILKQKLDAVRLSEDTVEADDQFGELGAHMQGG